VQTPTSRRKAWWSQTWTAIQAILVSFVDLILAILAEWKLATGTQSPRLSSR
jgi:hypothetical protein